MNELVMFVCKCSRMQLFQLHTQCLGFVIDGEAQGPMEELNKWTCRAQKTKALQVHKLSPARIFTYARRLFLTNRRPYSYFVVCVSIALYP